ncbi:MULTISPECIES: hypothetical protein [unclassified Pedobacter]|uniref:hypothetical protein n=1 Tax=unclassified Pedobacter TaxID=2628915 RepID=UPI0014221449|nr:MULTISPECIES: hypothetical protein [unclassified Pedobacter]NII84735.1 hypothetical protein [Pedobacter sp. SG908]NMN38355.1 hypothetical protein [Pedobacter sp. SG918]
MALASINLSVKQYFNFMCRTDFERRIFHDTYKEFQKRSKIYSLDQRLHTFSQMQQANEKANTLNQKLQYSVMNSIAALAQKMPVLNDLEDRPILFDWAELHIYDSDLLNKAAHVVSITYTSPKLILHEIVGDLLILSYNGKEHETLVVKITENLIVNYEQHESLVYS